MLINGKVREIIRYSTPGKFDQLPKGVICKVIKRKTENEVYLQTSNDVDRPVWKLLASVCLDTSKEDRSYDRAMPFNS